MIGKLKKMIQGLKSSNTEDCCNPVLNVNESVCPSCKTKGGSVPLKTVQFHIKNPWKQNLKDQKYFYCNSDDCDFLYFGENGSSIDTNSKREPNTFDTLCYCFGVSKKDLEAEENQGQIKTWVIEQTKSKKCACEINNPSGICCLGNFPK